MAVKSEIIGRVLCGTVRFRSDDHRERINNDTLGACPACVLSRLTAEELWKFVGVSMVWMNECNLQIFRKLENLELCQ